MKFVRAHSSNSTINEGSQLTELINISMAINHGKSPSSCLIGSQPSTIRKNHKLWRFLALYPNKRMQNYLYRMCTIVSPKPWTNSLLEIFGFTSLSETPTVNSTIKIISMKQQIVMKKENKKHRSFKRVLNMTYKTIRQWRAVIRS